MFEAALITALRNISGLTTYLTTYNGQPSIFSNLAPETAQKPYLIFDITSAGPVEKAVEQMNVYINLHDQGTSLASMRAAIRAIEYGLDRTVLSNSDYDNIRIFYFNKGLIPQADPRDLHYNIQFSARAGRKGWMATI